MKKAVPLNGKTDGSDTLVVDPKRYESIRRKLEKGFAAGQLREWVKKHKPKTTKLTVELPGCIAGENHAVCRHEKFVPKVEPFNIHTTIIGGRPSAPDMVSVVTYFCSKCNCLIPEHLAVPGSDKPKANEAWFANRI